MRKLIQGNNSYDIDMHPAVALFFGCQYHRLILCAFSLMLAQGRPRSLAIRLLRWFARYLSTTHNFCFL